MNKEQAMSSEVDYERKRAVAAIHWVFSADGTKSERSMADEAINKINDPNFMPPPRSASPSIGRVTTDGRDGWNNEELAVRVLSVADAVEERFGGLRVTFNEGGVGREGGSMSVKEVCDMLANMLRTGAPPALQSHNEGSDGK